MKNEIAEQFQMLNGHIASAISQKDYTRAATLDRARQDILTLTGDSPATAASYFASSPISGASPNGLSLSFVSFRTRHDTEDTLGMQLARTRKSAAFIRAPA